MGPITNGIPRREHQAIGELVVAHHAQVGLGCRVVAQGDVGGDRRPTGGIQPHGAILERETTREGVGAAERELAATRFHEAPAARHHAGVGCRGAVVGGQRETREDLHIAPALQIGDLVGIGGDVGRPREHRGFGAVTGVGILGAAHLQGAGVHDGRPVIRVARA